MQFEMHLNFERNMSRLCDDLFSERRQNFHWCHNQRHIYNCTCCLSTHVWTSVWSLYDLWNCWYWRISGRDTNTLRSIRCCYCSLNRHPWYSMSFADFRLAAQVIWKLYEQIVSLLIFVFFLLLTRRQFNYSNDKNTLALLNRFWKKKTVILDWRRKISLQAGNINCDYFECAKAVCTHDWQK